MGCLKLPYCQEGTREESPNFFWRVYKKRESGSKSCVEYYRWGFQGQFSEEDAETGWNSFEARSWDPVVSRWISRDPARQFWSPYVGMGNDPINQIDPDGRYSKFGALWRSGFGLRGRVYQSGVDNGREVWGYERNGTHYFGDDSGSLLRALKESATTNNNVDVNFDDVVNFNLDVKNVALSSAQLSSGIWFEGRANSIKNAAFSGNKWTAKALGNASDKAPLFATRLGGGTTTLKVIDGVNFVGKGLGAYNAYDIWSQYNNNQISEFHFLIEQASNGYSTFGGIYGAAWGIGWETGRAITTIPAYQRWKHNTWLPARQKLLGY